uniref:PH01B001I13.23 protein n=1 Tax=Phyllostachys edulis TaxID=38705 RepID=L0P2E7_PHYED|nr:PH01B001I13.23 [Phyllostachys edulis]
MPRRGSSTPTLPARAPSLLTAHVEAYRLSGAAPTRRPLQGPCLGGVVPTRRPPRGPCLGGVASRRLRPHGLRHCSPPTSRPIVSVGRSRRAARLEAHASRGRLHANFARTGSATAHRPRRGLPSQWGGPDAPPASRPMPRWGGPDAPPALRPMSRRGGSASTSPARVTPLLTAHVEAYRLSGAVPTRLPPRGPCLGGGGSAPTSLAVSRLPRGRGRHDYVRSPLGTAGPVLATSDHADERVIVAEHQGMLRTLGSS